MNTVSIDGQVAQGLRFDKLPLWPRAARKYATYQVPGRGQNLTYGLEDFEDIEMALTAYLIGSTHIDDVYAWLSSGTQLVMSTQPGVYGIIKQVGKITPAREGWAAHRIEIPLICAPFKYSIANDPVQLTDNPSGIQYDGTLYSLPVYVLRGVTGEATLTVHGVPLTIPGVTGGQDVYVDLTLRKIYTITDGVRTLVNNTSGAFWEFILRPPGMGGNIIAWSGATTGVTLIKNTRWL